MGYDTETFESYVDLLVDANENLHENNQTSKQLAVNNLRLNEGLKELSSSWSDISTVFKEGKRGTIEYAQAIGKVKNALEQAFGHAPSTKFVEDNFELIEALANGNIEALDSL
jgi:hypothetical protein